MTYPKKCVFLRPEGPWKICKKRTFPIAPVRRTYREKYIYHHACRTLTPPGDGEHNTILLSHVAFRVWFRPRRMAVCTIVVFPAETGIETNDEFYTQPESPRNSNADVYFIIARTVGVIYIYAIMVHYRWDLCGSFASLKTYNTCPYGRWNTTTRWIEETTKDGLWTRSAVQVFGNILSRTTNPPYDGRQTIRAA